MFRHHQVNVTVLLSSLCVLLALLMLCPGDVAGQFTAAPPTCPGDTFTFRCSVSGNMNGVTIWRVAGSIECILVHRATSTAICGNNIIFTARPEAGFGTSATSFTSTLSGTADSALNGTLVECFGPANNVQPGNRVDGSTLQIRGFPTIPTLSCVGLSGDVSGTVNVTVSWTLSGGDSADINITTNDPQTPYGGLLNIAITSVTLLTGFTAGYQYNITVRGVNCGSQKGGESEPLIITLQIPATPTPHVCAVYDMINEVLQIIESTWNEVDSVAVSQSCTSGQNTSYEIFYTTASGALNTTCVVDGSECSNGICRHELQSNVVDSRCQPPVFQFSDESVTISVTARSIVGRSNSTVANRFSIRNIDLGVRIDTTNLSSAVLECSFFQPGYNCTIDYGTDPSYTNLDYRDTSSTLGRIVIIRLSQILRADITYYYIVSAKSSSQCVKEQGTFRSGCTNADLSDHSGTANTASCADRRFVNSSSISGGAVCYNGTTAGSLAVYFCNDDFVLIGNEARVCLGDGNWNGSIPQCVRMESVQIGHIVGGAIGGNIGILLVFIIIVILIVVYRKFQAHKASDLLEQRIINAIEKEDQSVINRWLQNGKKKVNKCRGGRANHRHFVVADGTALHWAVYYGKLDIAQQLLRQDADPSQKTKTGETVIHWACLANTKNSELLKMLLDFHDKDGSLVNAPESSWLLTPLHLACWDSNKDLVQLLLEAGADQDARDLVGATPKDRLSEDEENYQEILDLLDKKSEPILQDYIIKAIEMGELSTVEQWLLKEDTRVNESKGGRAFPGHNTVANGNALHWAVHYGQLEIARLLLDKGADLYQKSRWNENVLHWACQGKKKKKEVLQFLLKFHIKDEPFLDVPDSAWHFTPLHYACCYNNKELIELLLEAGADQHARDNYGATPKDRLSEEEENYREIVGLLNRKSGFDPQQQSQQQTSRESEETIV